MSPEKKPIVFFETKNIKKNKKTCLTIIVPQKKLGFAFQTPGKVQSKSSPNEIMVYRNKNTSNQLKLLQTTSNNPWFWTRSYLSLKKHGFSSTKPRSCRMTRNRKSRWNCVKSRALRGRSAFSAFSSLYQRFQPNESWWATSGERKRLRRPLFKGTWNLGGWKKKRFFFFLEWFRLWWCWYLFGRSGVFFKGLWKNKRTRANSLLMLHGHGESPSWSQRDTAVVFFTVS